MMGWWRFFFLVFGEVLLALEDTQTTHPAIYWGQTFSSNASSSLIEVRRNFLSVIPTVADCALVCLHSARCLTAVFDSQVGTCSLFKETFADGGQLVPAASNAIAAIMLTKTTPWFLSSPNDMVYAVWDTRAGGNSTPATAGYTQGSLYPPGLPNSLFDGDLTTTLDMYGVCNISYYGAECGENTGVYAVSRRGAFVLTAFRIGTGYYGSSRDPMFMTIEGSNQTDSSLTLGSSWTLLYNGTSGLAVHPGLFSWGIKQTVSNNSLAFTSYRFLILSKRDSESCVEFSEIQVFSA